ncbi:antitoxin CptB [Thalassovita litoralis]|jgi:antitoxin CptB|uniref:FAD assembly factor SdhE n=1 Tax=Thalassovita litoralis TaxID=1010611 RepID=A0A521DHQ4_9RHOB|nr:succinate dehydrogenase assembly factor 2 [Thalassovita litoralis]SMO71158.1 antitoxin CptB [Thalassovita litoralis]
MSVAPSGETHENRLKRLSMRSMRRGIKEMDIILSRYADAKLAAMSDDELTEYDALLSENDQDLYQWVSGQVIPDARFAGLIGDIRNLIGAAE